MKSYKFEIIIRDNASGSQWPTFDFTEAENDRQALINIDEQNDSLGYKVMSAIITEIDGEEV